MDTAACQLVDDLCRFYQVLYTGDRYLPEPALQQLRTVTQRFGDNYQLLRELCRERGLLFFNVTPKVHKMQHVPLLAEVMNPRYVQNYAEESLIGTCTRIWAKSVSGRYRLTAQKAVIANELVGLLMRFEL